MNCVSPDLPLHFNATAVQGGLELGEAVFRPGLHVHGESRLPVTSIDGNSPIAHLLLHAGHEDVDLLDRHFWREANLLRAAVVPFGEQNELVLLHGDTDGTS